MDVSNLKSTGLIIKRALENHVWGAEGKIMAMGRGFKGHIQGVFEGNIPRAMVGGGNSIDLAV